MTLPRFVCGAVAAFLLLVPVPLTAQGRDAFARSVVELVNLLGEARSDEQPAVQEALDAMTVALREWDRMIAGVESGLAANIDGAPAQTAARMRAAVGAAYLERGRVQDAIAQFELAVTLDPVFAEVQRLRGMAYTLSGAPEQTAAAFRSAWLASPDKRADSAYLFLRSSSRSVPPADLEQATTALLTEAEHVPRDGGLSLSFFGLDLLDETSLETPVFAPVRYAEGFGLLREGRYDDALGSLERAARAPGPTQDERGRLSAGDALIVAGDLSGAREAYYAATMAMPGSGLAHWKMGQVHLQFADERSAARSFEAAAALGLFAGARHVHAALGRLYHNQLDLERAAEAYERRVAVAPNDGIGHADLGDVYRSQDRLDDALVEYLVSALLRPDDPRGFAMAGQVLVSTGRDVVAVRMLEAAIRRDPRHLEARYALARALMRLGRTDAARAELQTFEQLQAEAMAEERRRFEENARRIDEALTTGAREPQR